LFVDGALLRVLLPVSGTPQRCRCCLTPRYGFCHAFIYYVAAFIDAPPDYASHFTRRADYDLATSFRRLHCWFFDVSRGESAYH